MLIVYELPAWAHGNESAAQTYQRIVLAAAASAAPGSEHVVAAQLVGGAAGHLWSALVADFQAFEAREITAEELESRIEKVAA